MRTLSIDTDPEIEEILLSRLREMTVPERLERMSELTQGMRELAAVGVRRRHGDIDERELALRLAALTVDRELMVAAFGWDPEQHGY